MRVLCVAEKPSIAKSVAELLSGGAARSRPGRHRYCKNFDFAYRLPQYARQGVGDVEMVVTSVLGHLMEHHFVGNIDRNWQIEAPEALFFESDLTKTVTETHREVETNLQLEARRADLLVIWTDCDREGENIGAEVAAVCRNANPRIQVKRARFSVIQARELHRAMQNLVDLDLRQSEAVDARSELDLRIGAAFTRFLTMRFRDRFVDLQDQVLSYGSCQFPTLGFVVDAFHKVDRFVPEPFWYIDVVAQRMPAAPHLPPTQCHFTWARGRVYDRALCLVLFEGCVTNPTARVMNVATRPKSKWKPLPLTTVELQKLGVRYLRMPSDQVMNIAERLYQQGIVSYPRTETNEFEDAVDLRPLVEMQAAHPEWGGYAAALLNPPPADQVPAGRRPNMFERPRKGGKNDKAHPPIHPTRQVSNLVGDEKRVYELITRRFLAACSRDAVGAEATVGILLAGESFTASGLTVYERNYLDVYPYDRWTTHELPPFQMHEEFIPRVCEMKEGRTSPPSLLTEADLIALMDANGIGTDATIHEHIKKILERKYVVKQPAAAVQGGPAAMDVGNAGRGGGGGGGNHVLFPTTLGIALVEAFDALTTQSLAKPHLRAAMEADLVAICNGAKNKAQVVDQALRQFQSVYRRAVVRAAQIEQSPPANRLYQPPPPPNNNNFPPPPPINHYQPPGGGRGGGGYPGAPGPRPPFPPPPGPASLLQDLAAGMFATNTPDTDDRTCQCGLVAVVKTVGKDGPNKGRSFYTCPKVSQADQCRFFEWADDLANGAAAGGRRGGRGGGVSARGGRGGGGRGSRGGRGVKKGPRTRGGRVNKRGGG
ncbi:DNA topoisomerase [Allomyces javanicus]|nr:DNA topoisomerase [Allomyces javanicus]